MSDNIKNVGGFNIEGDDERYTFVNDPINKNDIERKTIVRIGTYLSDVTEGKIVSQRANQYPVDTINQATTTLSTQKGNPQRLTLSKNSKIFSDANNSGVSLDITLRNPDPVNSELYKTWQKGTTDDLLENGQTLLKNSHLPNSPIKNVVSAIMNNNRFTQSNKMIDEIVPNKRYNPTIRLPEKNSFGTYNERDTYNDDSFDKLALVGHILSLRASGELDSNSDGYNPISGGSEAKAILPSANQLAIERINPTTLEARDVYTKMANVEQIQQNKLNISDSSWGAMNNINDPFSGITSIGMPVLAATLTIAVLTALEVFGGIASLVSGKPINAPTKHPDGRYVYGRWSTELKGKAQSGPTLSLNFPPPMQDVLGIRQTQYPFMKALNKGMFLFFGMDLDGGLLSTVLGGVDQAIETPGYNAVVCRTILRSSLAIIDQIKDLFNSKNFISGVKNVLSVLEVVKRSKLMSAVNVFTTLGDLALSQMEGLVEVDRDGYKICSEIDQFSNEIPGASVKKSKLNGTNKLAWANNRTPSVFLMPSTVMGLSIASYSTKQGEQLAAPLQHTLRAESLSKNDTIIDQGDKSLLGSNMRIPQTSNDPDQVTVEAMERLLDAEYVPFYFQDLRTNEILSFHSFLNNLTEDYSPQWESTDAFGRVDKIKIYKSTDRRISVGFWIVSTGPHDFDDMWVKINKLVTLVYPQYSSGRKISPQNYNFTMPFSQIMTSSPIIRLRIGDLVRSNYSKFNLARVFGLTDYDKPMLNNAILQFDTTFKAFLDIKSKYAAMIKRPWNSDGKKYKWYIYGSDRFNVAESGLSINIPIPIVGSGGSEAGVPLKIPQSLLQYYNVEPIKKYDSGGGGGINININVSPFGGNSSSDDEELAEAGVFSLTPMSETEIRANWDIDPAKAIKIAAQLKEYEKNGSNSQKTKGREYILNNNNVRLQERSVRQFWIDNNVSTFSGIDKVLEFMSAKNNAIVRSFQETGGKGLAGVIESLAFDWNDQVTWETEQNRKAPTRCKVTFTFSPIHDISPGLDHFGANRANIYPVGNLNSEIIRDKI